MEQRLSLKRGILSLIILILSVYLFFTGMMYVSMPLLIIGLYVSDQLKKEDFMELIDYLNYIIKVKVFKVKK